MSQKHAHAHTHLHFYTQASNNRPTELKSMQKYGPSGEKQERIKWEMQKEWQTEQLKWSWQKHSGAHLCGWTRFHNQTGHTEKGMEKNRIVVVIWSVRIRAEEREMWDG